MIVRVVNVLMRRGFVGRRGRVYDAVSHSRETMELYTTQARV